MVPNEASLAVEDPAPELAYSPAQNVARVRRQGQKLKSEREREEGATNRT